MNKQNLLRMFLCVLVGLTVGMGCDNSGGSLTHTSGYRIKYMVQVADDGIQGLCMPIPANFNETGGMTEINLLGIFPEWGEVYETTYGNRIVHWSNVSGGELLGYEIEVRLLTINTYMNSDIITSPSGEALEFLEPTSLAQSHNTTMIEVAKTIVGDETNALLCAEMFASWIQKEISLSYGNHDALTTFYERTGECSGRANLFVAFCQAVGIPARIVSGVFTPGSVILESGTWQGPEPGEQEDAFVFHIWAEVYLAPYGWIQFDSQYSLGVIFQHRLTLSRGGDIFIPQIGELRWWLHMPVDIRRGQYEGSGIELSVELID